MSHLNSVRGADKIEAIAGGINQAFDAIFHLKFNDAIYDLKFNGNCETLSIA